MKTFFIGTIMAMVMFFMASLGNWSATASQNSSFISTLIHMDEALAEESGMDRVRIVLKKLRDAMASMQELDELEKAGMPKKDVDRMRRAMRLKINDMMTDAMTSIRSL